ncbi:MAG: M23 family metallopeptidase [Chromatiales bacterium]|nr:M23 family metallopeptidase [Chromatiales bacterium]
MQVIILSKAGNRRRRRDLGWLATRGLVLAVVAAVALAFWGGHATGRRDAGPGDDRHALALSRAVHAQRDRVGEAIARAEDGIDALARQLGEQKARLLRLEALGKRLTRMADLDPEELDFAAPPALGGLEPADAAAPAAYRLPDLVAELEILEALLDDRGPKLAAIESALMTERVSREVSPSGRPVEKGWVSSLFGWRSDPISGRRSFHEGLDFASRHGAPVLAVAGGVVQFVGTRSGFGKVVEVGHGRGLVTRYAHNSLNLVEEGERVRKGQTIAKVGATGHATGPHVHFEVLRDGEPVDPVAFVGDRR